MDKRTILLVEDNASDIELTKRALLKNRINNPLFVAEDGQQAVDYLLGESNDARPLPALTLLDLKLPGIPGLEVLRKIRSNPRTKRMPVVILTSSDEERDIARGYDIGANSYIRKPVDFKEFEEAIANLSSYWLRLNQLPVKTDAA